MQALGMLSQNMDFWERFGGPSLQRLQSPTQLILKDAKHVVARQRQWLENVRVSDDALEDSVNAEQLADYTQIVANTEKALERIQLLDWHSIRDECFFCAPPLFYNDLIPDMRVSYISCSLMNGSFHVIDIDILHPYDDHHFSWGCTSN